MIDKLDQTVHDKTPGLINPETSVLAKNQFKTSLVLIFSDLNKAQIYKMPYRDSPLHEVEILMSFIYLNLFKPNKRKEEYHIRKSNDENFLFDIGERIYIHMGEKLVGFETNDKIVNYSTDLGFSDIEFPFAYGQEKIYFV